MTTDKNLEAIEARLDAAGPGPWEWQAGATGVVIQTQHETAWQRAFVARIVAGSGAVVDFVAHAWGDLRYLTARVRALEAQVADKQASLIRSAERGVMWAEKAHQRRVALEAARALQTFYINRSWAMYEEEASLWMAFGAADRAAREETSEAVT